MAIDMPILRLLQDFHRVTGAHLSMYDPDFQVLAFYPAKGVLFCRALQIDPHARECCLKNDHEAFAKVQETGQPYVYRCHCGLTEIVAPLYHYGQLSGYVMMGQITDQNPESLERIRKLAGRFEQGELPAVDLCNTIPRIDEKTLQSFINILCIVAEYLTQSHAIRPKREELATSIRRYIERHYAENLKIETLCTVFACSRGTLARHFHQQFGQTISAYLNEYRLHVAAEQLACTDKSVKEITYGCGFTDQNYFAKVFQKQYGCSPSRYRAQHNK